MWNNRNIYCVKELLASGAFVNIANLGILSSIREKIGKGNVGDRNKDAIILLFAAGEWNAEGVKTAELLLPSHETAFRLEHICRDTIRKHLLHLDSHSNLFGRVPRLGLPSTLTDFMLYSQSLESVR